MAEMSHEEQVIEAAIKQKVCARNDCSKPPVAMPILILRPSHGTGEAHMALPFAVCKKHKKKLKFKDMFCEGAWHGIVRNFEEAGYPAPSMKASRVEWVTLRMSPKDAIKNLVLTLRAPLPDIDPQGSSKPPAEGSGECSHA